MQTWSVLLNNMIQSEWKQFCFRIFIFFSSLAAEIEAHATYPGISPGHLSCVRVRSDKSRILHLDSAQKFHIVLSRIRLEFISSPASHNMTHMWDAFLFAFYCVFREDFFCRQAKAYLSNMHIVRGATGPGGAAWVQLCYYPKYGLFF